MGANATPPGIGVRRAQIVFTRAAIGSGEDNLTTTIDFQNFTNGQPDDSWIDADFTTLEGLLDTFIQTLKPWIYSNIVHSEYRWYRIGPGISPPNPPARITARVQPGTATDSVPSQVAVTLTERTAVRRTWGRMYLPIGAPGTFIGDGRIHPSVVDGIGTAANTLYSSAFSADLVPVVYSPTRQKAFSVEHVQVDDLADVMRSRRYDKPTHKSIHP